MDGIASTSRCLMTPTQHYPVRCSSFFFSSMRISNESAIVHLFLIFQAPGISEGVELKLSAEMASHNRSAFLLPSCATRNSYSDWQSNNPGTTTAFLSFIFLFFSTFSHYLTWCFYKLRWRWSQLLNAHSIRCWSSSPQGKWAFELSTQQQCQISALKCVQRKTMPVI